MVYMVHASLAGYVDGLNCIATSCLHCLIAATCLHCLIAATCLHGQELTRSTTVDMVLQLAGTGKIAAGATATVQLSGPDARAMNNPNYYKHSAESQALANVSCSCRRQPTPLLAMLLVHICWLIAHMAQ